MSMVILGEWSCNTFGLVTAMRMDDLWGENISPQSPQNIPDHNAYHWPDPRWVTSRSIVAIQVKSRPK